MSRPTPNATPCVYLEDVLPRYSTHTLREIARRTPSKWSNSFFRLFAKPFLVSLKAFTSFATETLKK